MSTSPLTIKLQQSGRKNHDIAVSGIVSGDLDMIEILNRDDITDCNRLNLKALVFAVQEKMGLVLWWGKDDLIMPVESRGSFSFEVGLQSPGEWKGKVYLSTFKALEPPTPKHFLLILNFDKQ